MPTFLFVLATVFWGASFMFIKVALIEVSPLTLVFLRFLIALISLLPVPLYQQQKITRTDLSKGILLGCLLTAMMLSQTVGLQTVSASVGAFLLGFSIVFVLMIRFLIQKKVPSMLDVVATLGCVGGLGLVTQSHGITLQGGVFYVLLAALFMALHIYLMELYVKDSSPLILTLIQMLFVTIVAGLAILTIEGSLSLPIQNATWLSILACAILCTSVGFAIQAYAQQYLSAFKISMITTLEPVFATIFSRVFLGEVLQPSFYLGAILILTSIVLINWRLQELGE